MAAALWLRLVSRCSDVRLHGNMSKIPKMKQGAQVKGQLWRAQGLIMAGRHVGGRSGNAHALGMALLQRLTAAG